MNNLESIFKKTDDINRPYSRAQYRELNPKAFKHLQDTIKLYKQLYPNSKTPPETVTKYKNEYGISQDVARSDYIFEWTRYLQKEFVRLGKKVYQYSQEPQNMIDYVPRVIDYKDAKGNIYDAYSFIDRIYHNLPYLHHYSQKETYSLKVNDLEKELITEGAESFRKKYKDKVFTNKGNLKKKYKNTFKDFIDVLKSDRNTLRINDVGGKRNLLAISNLIYATRVRGWTTAYEILNKMSYDEIARIWKEAREGFDMVFIYTEYFYESEDYTMGNDEMAFLAEIYQHASASTRKIIDDMDKNGLLDDELVRSGIK